MVLFILIPNWEGLKFKSERLTEDMLQNKNVRGVMQYWEHRCRHGYHKRPEAETTTLRDKIYDILERFWGSWNLYGFGEGKSGPNIRKQIENWSSRKKVQGTAEEADQAEALESVSFRVLVLHASSPERGRWIYGQPPLPPTPKQK